MAAAKKESTTTTKAKKPSAHPAYKDMIKDAILQLKERNGSSRQALKKYIQSNHEIQASNFEVQFNAALRRGVQNGDFVQPKGPSGPVKLKKKEPGETKPKASSAPAKKAEMTKKVAKKTPTKTAVKPKAKKEDDIEKKTKKSTTKPAAKTTKATKTAVKKESAGKVTKAAAKPKTRTSPKRTAVKAK
jgi:histone H1/5